MSSYGPAASMDAMEAAAGSSYRVCDTVVLFCLAFASALIVLTVAVCFRRAFANGYAAGAAAAGANAAGAATGRDRCGLPPSALSAIPMIAYRRGAAAAGGGAGWAQCAICLAVVRDGETVRLLPACGHLFHVECIDLWLRSHPTCPLCRRDVGEPAAEKV